MKDRISRGKSVANDVEYLLIDSLLYFGVLKHVDVYSVEVISGSSGCSIHVSVKYYGKTIGVCTERVDNFSRLSVDNDLTNNFYPEVVKIIENHKLKVKSD